MQRIGAYDILEELGRGGMGVVYRGYDPAINRLVAVKVIRLDSLTDPDEKAFRHDRLLREARSAGGLSHPGIVTIYHIGQEGELAFIVMEHVAGGSFETLLASAPPPGWDRTVSILRKTAVALDYAHSKGVLHRDVKPANVLIDNNGDVKICDFGIAKTLGAGASTQTGVRLGSPIYMSPEQVKGHELDGRSDQYSLAAMSYLALTGSPPFQGQQIETLFYKIVMEKPPSADSLNPRLGPEAGAVLDRGLAKNAADRYPSCGDFVWALEAALENAAAGFSQTIEHARDLLTRNGPGAAEAYLEPLTVRYGGDAEFTSLFASVIEAKRRESEQQERADRLRRGMEQVEHCLQSDRWQDALMLLEPLERDFPGEPAVAPLADRVGEARFRAAVRERTQQALRTARKHLARKEFREVREALQPIEGDQPADPEVLDLLSRVDQEENAERERLAHLAGLHQTLEHSRGLLERGAPEEAAAFLDSETARFGGDSEFRSMFASVIEAKRLEDERKLREEERKRMEAALAEAQREERRRASEQALAEQAQLEQALHEQAQRERASRRVVDPSPIQATQILQPEAPRLEPTPPVFRSAGAEPPVARKRTLAAVAVLVTLAVLGAVVYRITRPQPAIVPSPSVPSPSVPAGETAKVQPAPPPATGNPVRTAPAPKKPKETEPVPPTPVGGKQSTDKHPVAAEDPEEAEWRALAGTTSPPEIEGFLRKYPNGVHKTDAARRLERLEWDLLQYQLNPPAWRAFLSKYPVGEFSKLAAEKLEDLEWTGLKKNDAAALRGFRANYPNGPHAAQAADLLDRLAILDALGRYSAAIEHRDENQLHDVWPSIPAATLEQWRQDFKGAQSLRMQLLGDPTVTFHDATARADCNYRITKSYPGNAQNYSTQSVARISLRKSAGRWVIESVR